MAHTKHKTGTEVSAHICECSPQDLQPFGQCTCQPSKNGNKVKNRIAVLEASIEIVSYKIKHLSPYFSCHQVRAWKKNRKSLRQQVAFLKGVLAIAEKQKSAKKLLQEPHRKLILASVQDVINSIERQERSARANESAGIL